MGLGNVRTHVGSISYPFADAVCPTARRRQMVSAWVLLVGPSSVRLRIAGHSRRISEDAHVWARASFVQERTAIDR